MQESNTIQSTIDHLFRHESGKMISVLSRLLGLQHLDKAQDLVQDTLLQAMNTWPYKGIPNEPEAWLYRVAKNKAIDYLRREKKFKEISPRYAYLLQSETTAAPFLQQLFLDNEIQDSQLRMIFACCHPAIPPESQIALSLKTLCGLSIAEIARAFLTQEETIAKRIYRAREKIRTEGIELDLPEPSQLTSRLDGVLHSLYLLFNEGYNSSHPEQLIRDELCEEAIRLTYLLTLQPLTAQPRTYALLSLLCFQASRLNARIDEANRIVLLRQQDRSKWFQPLIQKGFDFLEKAMETGPGNSKYHFEAGIASIHASAKSFEETDWPSIYFLYERLYELHPGPIVAMNKGIAAAYALGREEALKQLLCIEGLESYYLFHTSIGELYLEMGKKQAAKQYYQTALQLTSSKMEQELLRQKIVGCGEN